MERPRRGSGGAFQIKRDKIQNEKIFALGRKDS